VQLVWTVSRNVTSEYEPAGKFAGNDVGVAALEVVGELDGAVSVVGLLLEGLVQVSDEGESELNGSGA
jgi:hypothetical protein